jgi:outer membrane protein assembly factor BamB
MPLPKFRTVTILGCLVGIGGALAAESPAEEAHRVLMQGNDKLAIVAADGSVEWEMKWGGIHDLHLLDNGHILVQENMNRVVEIDPNTKQVVWRYDAAAGNGNAGRPLEIHAFQPLPDGLVMIAESGPARIIEIDRQGKIHREIKLRVDHPHPHTDTRLVRKLSGDHYLVCHEADGAVREYDSRGKIVWDYEVPMFGREPQGGHGPEAFGNKCFAAVRLANGNTLISTGNGHGLIEVTPTRQIVWHIGQHDLPGITLAWVTTLEVLPNGNYVIGNCHAGPDNPLLIEIDPRDKQVVWRFDRFDLFGNSASNSQLVDLQGRTLR